MQRFAYTGHEERLYPAYRDADTGHCLTAQPGGTYAIAAVEEDAPVPPPDGRWMAVPAPEPPEPKAPKTAPKSPVKEGE